VVRLQPPQQQNWIQTQIRLDSDQTMIVIVSVDDLCARLMAYRFFWGKSFPEPRVEHDCFVTVLLS
jgi:hypothetical protein